MFLQLKLLFLSTFVALAFGFDWKTFKSVHNLAFSSGAEEIKRSAIFNQNMDAITNHNLKAIFDKSITFTLGANQFSHLTYDEIVATRTGYYISLNGCDFE
jgi:hypothetical protein